MGLLSNQLWRTAGAAMCVVPIAGKAAGICREMKLECVASHERELGEP